MIIGRIVTIMTRCMWCYQVRPWFWKIGLLGLGRGGRRAGGAAGDPAEQVGGGRRIVRERQLMGSSIRLRAPVGAPPPFERAALYHPSPVRCTCGLCVRERPCRGKIIYLTIVNGNHHAYIKICSCNRCGESLRGDRARER